MKSSSSSSSGVSISVIIILVFVYSMFFPWFTANADYFDAQTSVVFQKYAANEDRVQFNFFETGDYEVTFEFPAGYTPAENETLPQNFSINVDKPGLTKIVEVYKLNAVRVTISHEGAQETHLFVRPVRDLH